MIPKTTKHEKILAQEDKMKSAKGKQALLKYANGKRITPGEAIQAYCYDCQGYYQDIVSNRDCGIFDCPLYPFHPYSSNREQNKPSMDMRDRIARGEMTFHGFTPKNKACTDDECEDGSETDSEE